MLLFITNGKHSSIDFSGIYQDSLPLTIFSLDQIKKYYYKGHKLHVIDKSDNSSGTRFYYQFKVIESYSLFDINTYIKLGIDITENEHIVDIASEESNIDFLNWWIESNIDLKYSEKSLDYPSNYGKINVLNWWLNSNLPLKYSEKSINFALNIKLEPKIK
ncbi:hypothetical protein H012_gp187 [Acanthamoeba polyphaga moumouvirus]|uniref:Uncharacterized protein n=1 Tax=Acanthamoeba polyphaga moumouvirus TaxID=1269028 RepID=L7RCE8_9VIRU|nr:hypothetical protein H012_gp187 [Acanthamoeba polyphaga moumouvirus]AGC02264.1 hypothetical protein Moumou_00745 [Acanthamoeba polyphaga moumouvirus]